MFWIITSSVTFISAETVVVLAGESCSYQINLESLGNIVKTILIYMKSAMSKLLLLLVTTL